MHCTIHNQILKNAMPACLWRCCFIILLTGEPVRVLRKKKSSSSILTAQRNWPSGAPSMMSSWAACPKALYNRAARIPACSPGTVSLENFGGFASASSLPAAYNLGGFTGIAIRVKVTANAINLPLRPTPPLPASPTRRRSTRKTRPGQFIQLPFKTFVPCFVAASWKMLSR